MIDQGPEERADPDDGLWLAAAERRAEDDAALTERIEVEQATSGWASQLPTSVGRVMQVRTSDAVQHEGVVAETGRDWMLLSLPRRARLLMLSEVVALVEPTAVDPALTHSGRRGLSLGVGSVYRRWGRVRSAVTVALRDGSQVSGQVRSVLADAAVLRTDSGLTLTLPFDAVVWATGEGLSAE